MNALAIHRSLIDTKSEDYQAKHNELVKLGQLLRSPQVVDAIRYFTHDNLTTSFHVPAINIVSTETAIEKLKKEYWQQMVVDSGIYQTLPAARREEWKLQMEGTLPDFTKENIVSTLKGLVLNQENFFAERVDGIFKALSGSHVTNEPQGFSKRMIFEYISHCVPALTDLRTVVSELYKRPSSISEKVTRNNLEFAQNTASGKWMIMDGGIVKFRVYKKGTVHVEIHPQVAWKLNEYLALLYPMAIPPAMRKKVKSEKVTPINYDLVPSQITHLLSLAKKALIIDPARSDRAVRVENSVYVDSKVFDVLPKDIQRQYRAIMEILDGTLVKVKNFNGSTYEYYQFAYEPSSAITEILMTGQLPNKESFQYYPTSDEKLQDVLMDMADVQEEHSKLEPSAGSGHIAERMGADTVCVELSSSRCEILKAKGFNKVICEDFVMWAQKTDQKFDRIVMNPPFADGRALQHVRLASMLLNKQGRLTAVVPVNFDASEISGVVCVGKSEPFKGAFVGTGVIVKVISLELAH
jgi:hypothetical protein